MKKKKKTNKNKTKQNKIKTNKTIKNSVPYCPEALRYAKVWGRDIVRSLTLAYAKRREGEITLKKKE